MTIGFWVRQPEFVEPDRRLCSSANLLRRPGGQEGKRSPTSCHVIGTTSWLQWPTVCIFCSRTITSFGMQWVSPLSDPWEKLLYLRYFWRWQCTCGWDFLEMNERQWSWRARGCIQCRYGKLHSTWRHRAELLRNFYRDQLDVLWPHAKH